MAVLGMRGVGSFGAYERPKNYRQGILLLNPNGDAPLTCILSKLKEQATNDPQFYWYEKGIPLQRATLTGYLVATSIASTPTANADAATNTIPLASTMAVVSAVPIGGALGTPDVSIFKPGHLLLNEVSGEVYLVTDTGSGKILIRRDIGIKFQQGGVNYQAAINTDNAGTTGDTVVIIGSGFPEGAPVGDSIAYQPVKHYNFTQIFRTPLQITRTARKTSLRWGSEGPYMEAKRESLQLHGVEMERAFLLGQRQEFNATLGTVNSVMATTANAPLRTTQGILGWLPAATISSVSVHTNLTSYNGGALTESIFDSFCEETFRYGSPEKLALVGSTALNVITQMAKNKAMIEMVPQDQTYGMNLRRYLTPFGSLLLYNHPLLSDNPTMRGDLYVVDVEKLSYRYITDTTFLTNRQSPGQDATIDEFLTEAGLECHFSGAIPDSAASTPANTVDPGPSSAAPAAHGRLSGIATYGG